MTFKRSIRQMAWLLLAAAVVLAALSACGLEIPNTGGVLVKNKDMVGVLGQPFVASGVDKNGCPTDQVSQFTGDQAVYVGFRSSSIAEGTTMFIRLIHEKQSLLDTREITANRSTTACIWFVFRPSQPSTGLEPGHYQADLYLNDKRTNIVAFSVQNSGASSVAVSGGGFLGGSQDTSGIQLSNLITTDRVDDQGCPGDHIVEFRNDQPVYAAYDPFLLPAGSRMAARLLRNDQLVEQSTKTITAESDMNACVWFVFPDDGNGGIPSGKYLVQIFINGNQADSVQFAVR